MHTHRNRDNSAIFDEAMLTMIHKIARSTSFGRLRSDDDRFLGGIWILKDDRRDEVATAFPLVTP